MERAALRAALDRLAEGAATVSALALVGPPGSGRRALFDVVARELAVAGAAGTAPPIQVWRGSLDALAAWAQPAAPSPSVDPQRAAEARLAAIAEALEARARAQPLCVWLDDEPAATAFAAWAAGAPPSGRLLLVLPTREAPARPFAGTVPLAPLTEADLEALLAAAGDVTVPAGAAAALAAQSQGNAAVAGVLARRLIADLRAGRGAATRTEAGADLDELLADGYRALPGDARALVLALALADGAGDSTAPGALATPVNADAAHAAARAAGWLEATSDGAVRLPSAAHRRAALAAADLRCGRASPRGRSRICVPGAPARDEADDRCCVRRSVVHTSYPFARPSDVTEVPAVGRAVEVPWRALDNHTRLPRWIVAERPLVTAQLERNVTIRTLSAAWWRRPPTRPECVMEDRQVLQSRPPYQFDCENT